MEDGDEDGADEGVVFGEARDFAVVEGAPAFFQRGVSPAEGAPPVAPSRLERRTPRAFGRQSARRVPGGAKGAS